MRVLIALTYYRPHVSGLTIYAERLARGLARRGHAVTVLTSRFSPALAEREESDGVSVVRVPVALKVSKGVIMPRFPAAALAAIAEADVVNVHMPQFEAALLTCWRACAGGRWCSPTSATCACRPAPSTAPSSGACACSTGWPPPALTPSSSAATTTPATSFLAWTLSAVHAIAPLVDLPEPRDADTEALRATWGARRPTIGFAARFAAEKGVEYLLKRCRRCSRCCRRRRWCSAAPTRTPSARRPTGSGWCRCSTSIASGCASSTCCRWRRCRASSPPATCWR
ncbi:MAG: glycosyltransferase [Candidatus Binatia bacterium]